MYKDMTVRMFVFFQDWSAVFQRLQSKDGPDSFLLYDENYLSYHTIFHHYNRMLLLCHYHLGGKTWISYSIAIIDDYRSFRFRYIDRWVMLGRLLIEIIDRYVEVWNIDNNDGVG
jgi:hypothetical protein